MPSKRYRLMVSCLLLLCLSGFSIGARESAALISQQTAGMQARFRYDALSREGNPLLLGLWLKEGKYASFVRAAEPAFPIPALSEGYIPQGMCYSEALGRFVLSYYFPEGKQPSLVALVDPLTGVCTKQLYLLRPDGSAYTGHAGGAAAWGEHVWITSGNTAYRLAAEDLRRAEDRSALAFRDTFQSAARGSFAFCSGDTLWLGDYYTSGQEPEYFGPQKELSSGNHARAAAYPLSADAPMGVAGLTKSGGSPAPAAMLSIPDRIQGACVAADGRLLLSISYSTKLPSYLQVYPSFADFLARPPDYEVTVNDQTCPLWVLSETQVARTQILPPMSEGICSRDGKVYVLYESAALKFRTSVQLYADHVFAIPEKNI